MAGKQGNYGTGKRKGAVAKVWLLPGSGEITHLEFHMNPALTGSLRHVVVEFFYDGALEPSVRLPITDLAGVPHPWSEGRWDSYSGTLAGGLRW